MAPDHTRQGPRSIEAFELYQPFICATTTPPDTIDMQYCCNQSKDANTTENPSVSQKKQSLAHYIASRIWLAEIGAWLLSLACMATIILVFIREDGRPLDEWNLFISPFALISFMSILARASLMVVLAEVISQLKWLHFNHGKQVLHDIQLFDEASRGILGSLKILIFRPRSMMIASCAAALAVLSFIIDPFVQLTLVVSVAQVPSPLLQSSFLTTGLYDPTGASIDQSASILTTEIRIAIVEGANGLNNPPSLICSTGNCTFPEKPTLGLHGECTDLSSQISTACNQTDEYHYQCTYEFPSGTILLGTQELQSGDQLKTAWNSTTHWIGGHAGRGDYVDILNIQGQQALVIGVEIIRIAEDDELSSPTAWLCNFTFAAVTFSGLRMVDGRTNFSEVLYDNLQFRGDMTNSTYFNLVSSTFTENGNDDQLDTYQVKSVDYNGMWGVLAAMFEIAVYAGGGAFTNDEPVGNAITTTPYIGQELMTSTNLPLTIGNIASGITEGIRSGPNSTAQLGLALTERSFIHVNWIWMMLPITLALCTGLLLAIVMEKTWSSQLVAWKSSELAVLLFQLEAVTVPAESLDNLGNLNRFAKKVAVTIRNGTQPAFVGSPP